MNWTRYVHVRTVFTLNSWTDTKHWRWIWVRVAVIVCSTTRTTWRGILVWLKTSSNLQYQTSPKKATCPRTTRTFISTPFIKTSTHHVAWVKYKSPGPRMSSSSQAPHQPSLRTSKCTPVSTALINMYVFLLLKVEPAKPYVLPSLKFNAESLYSNSFKEVKPVET